MKRCALVSLAALVVGTLLDVSYRMLGTQIEKAVMAAFRGER